MLYNAFQACFLWITTVINPNAIHNNIYFNLELEKKIPKKKYTYTDNGEMLQKLLDLGW